VFFVFCSEAKVSEAKALAATASAAINATTNKYTTITNAINIITVVHPISLDLCSSNAPLRGMNLIVIPHNVNRVILSSPMPMSNIIDVRDILVKIRLLPIHPMGRVVKAVVNSLQLFSNSSISDAELDGVHCG
jgi:hypothetical protein